MVRIREENQKDHQAVRILNNEAFGQPAEGEIIDKIRAACKETLSLVAVKDNQVVGHIFFSPVAVGPKGKKVVGMGLGPMAVKPQLQRQGIGTMLVNEGIKKIKNTECPFVVVLGHDTYYPRFGFKIASKYGLSPQWEGIPDASFMVMFFDESEGNNVSGVVNYRKEFNEGM